MKQYCWDRKSYEKFEIISNDPVRDTYLIKRVDGAVKISLNAERFEEQYALVRPASWVMQSSPIGAKCECGVEIAYGPNVPKSWHSDYCPKSK